MMSFFSSDAFLDALAEARFGAQAKCSKEVVELEGRRFRVLVVNGAPVGDAPFLDFVEPLDEAPERSAERRIRYLPSVVHRKLSVADWPPGPLPPRFNPSPTVEWASFPDWQAVVAASVRKKKNVVQDLRRRRNKLEREVGAIELSWHDERSDAFRQCLAWKSAQYRAAGFIDMLADERNVRLVEGLRARGVLTISSLRAGGKLLAVHVGAVHDGRLYYWLPAYDASARSYSPGVLLQDFLMEESFRRGHREFDFLIGNEDYKWLYATHVRLTGPLGTPPAALRIGDAAKETARRLLKAMPGAWEATGAIRRWLRARTRA